MTDRRVLDRQLQNTIRQFEQTLGVVENIDKNSKQLKTRAGRGQEHRRHHPAEVPGDRQRDRHAPRHSFCRHHRRGPLVTVRRRLEASQGSAERVQLDEAEQEEAGDEEDYEDRIAAEMAHRGRLPNLSFFAFTATPKPKTLELFGTRQPDGSFVPFSLYSMRQAIEEGFILDVLENYTTFKTYFNLLKRIEDDPSYDRDKAIYLLRSFVDLHEHAIKRRSRS